MAFRRRAFGDMRSVLGDDRGARTLIDILIAIGDPSLAHRLLKRLSKVTSAVAAIRRGVPDPVQREWLVQLVLRDTKDYATARFPAAVGDRFYALLRKTCERKRPRASRGESGFTPRVIPETRVVMREERDARRRTFTTGREREHDQP
jgi:hypothetical protein